MQANYVQRLRFRFGKDGPTRYISHLDLARTLERALNRARIPVAYTQGFNPRPRLQFASALPLGYTSEAELADILLREVMAPDQVREQLMARMAPGIDIHDLYEVPLSGASLQALARSATYRATPLDPVDPVSLRDRVASFLATPVIERERRGKTYDLRPLVHELRVEGGPAEPVSLWLRLSLQPGQTGRPDEVLLELGLEPLDVRVHRLALALADG